MSEVLWHDLECGSYVEDLDLWRGLAREAHGPVLDVGCGTGRVTIDLARRGHDVVGLDREPALLEALERRAAGLRVQTVCADARGFDLDRRGFALVLVPMQTIQLLGGVEGRGGLLRSARRHMAPGAVLAAALADAFEGAGDYHLHPPLPDTCEVDGVLYASRPVSVHEDDGRVAIERVRETVARDGRRAAEHNVVHLDPVDGATLVQEGEAAGFAALASRLVPATEEYVSSTVVMLRA